MDSGRVGRGQVRGKVEGEAFFGIFGGRKIREGTDEGD